MNFQIGYVESKSYNRFIEYRLIRW